MLFTFSLGVTPIKIHSLVNKTLAIALLLLAATFVASTPAYADEEGSCFDTLQACVTGCGTNNGCLAACAAAFDKCNKPPNGD